VSLIEKGGHGVDVGRLIRLAAALDMSLLEPVDVGSPPLIAWRGRPGGESAAEPRTAP